MSEHATLRRARSGAPGNGVLDVDDYLGAHAGDAARALRRAGFRPALDRQLGHPPERAGLVVAQEPAGGERKPRGAMVTLYVAAPGPSDAVSVNERGDGAAPDAQSAPAERPQSPSGPAAQAPLAPASGRPARASFSYRCSNRQTATPFGLRGPAHGEQAHDDRLCAPRALSDTQAIKEAERAAGDAGEEPPAPTRRRPQRAQRPDRAEPGSSAGDGEHPAAEVLERMRDAFAREPGETDRRVYPREPLSLRARGALAWMRRRWARVVICVVLLVWLTFALGHRGDLASRPSASSAPARRASAAQRPARAGERRRARRVDPRRHRRRPRRGRHTQGAAPRARQRSPARPSPTPVPAPAPSPARAREAATAASTGGPFSP